MDTKTVRLKVRGDYACFTRPDLKVERMTYPCMTPSAARGVLEAVLRKPEFIWLIREIWVLKPIKFLSIRRNELEEKGQASRPTIIEDKRVQRNSIILRDVEYLISAAIVVPESGEKNNSVKYLAMFNRRREKGQCYHRPFLGCREFDAEFSPPDGKEKPIDDTVPIGGMLLDIFFDEKGKAKPLFFEAKIENGRLDCEEIYRKSMLDSSHIRRTVPASYDNILDEWNKTELEEMRTEGVEL